MTGRVFLAALSMMWVAAWQPAGFAAVDLGETPPAPAEGLEIIVIEAEDCQYCAHLRMDLAGSGLALPETGPIKVRYLDINDKAVARLETRAPIEVVPTLLISAGGTEVARIPGYVGHTTLYQLLRQVFAGSG